MLPPVVGRICYRSPDGDSIERREDIHPNTPLSEKVLDDFASYLARHLDARKKAQATADH